MNCTGYGLDKEDADEKESKKRKWEERRRSMRTRKKQGEEGRRSMNRRRN